MRQWRCSSITCSTTRAKGRTCSPTSDADAGPESQVVPRNRLIQIPQPSPPTNELCQNTDYVFATDLRSRTAVVARDRVGRASSRNAARDRMSEGKPWQVLGITRLIGCGR